jgi:hypothetical protein
MPRLLSLSVLAAALAAADAVPTVSWDLRLGAFLQNVASRNAETSRDPSISGTQDSLSYQMSGEGTLVWQEARDRLEQRLIADYGQLKATDEGTWQESADRLFYSVTYERSIGQPQFLYLNGQADSVFSGRDPDNRPLDPLIVKLSTGYGQRHEDLLPLDDTLLWRLGVYIHRRWDRLDVDDQEGNAAGPEVLLRYERTQSLDVSYFGQIEAFSEFDDPGHATSAAEIGIDVKIGALLTVVVKARAYYEAEPEEARHRTGDGYDAWSMKEEALLGLLWNISSR